jgi:hypothetical protein
LFGGGGGGQGFSASRVFTEIRVSAHRELPVYVGVPAKKTTPKKRLQGKDSFNIKQRLREVQQFFRKKNVCFSKKSLGFNGKQRLNYLKRTKAFVKVVGTR